MAIRQTDDGLVLNRNVSFMPPDLVTCAEQLDPNFVGGYKTEGDSDSFPGSPGITSVDDFSYLCGYDDNGNLIDYTPPFTKEELLQKWQENYDLEMAKVYQIDRAAEYPQLGDQLDALFRDIQNGTLTTSGEFYTLINQVKTTYPKG